MNKKKNLMFILLHFDYLQQFDMHSNVFEVLTVKILSIDNKPDQLQIPIFLVDYG